MNWYTCIIHVQGHVNPVQYFFTRAATPDDAARHAKRFTLDGDGETWADEDVTVPFVFAGRLEPAYTDGD